MTSREDAVALFQAGYYDPIDRVDPGAVAAKVMHESVEFSHLPAWSADDLGQSHSEVDVVIGRDTVAAFLDAVLPFTKEAGLKHKVTDLVIDGDRGAFLAEVSSAKRPDVAEFMVWFELKDGLVIRYTMRPL